MRGDSEGRVGRSGKVFCCTRESRTFLNTNRKDPGKRKIRDAGKKRVTTQRGDPGGTQRPRVETALQRVLGGRRGLPLL